jgi:hypothetical protein
MNINPSNMKKIFRNFLALLIILGFRGISAKHDITIKLKVHGTDGNLTGKILGDLRNDLGNKPHIFIVGDTTDSSTFMITVQYATLKSGDKLVGIYMNSLLTRRVRTSKDESGDMLMNSSVSSISNPSEIDRICSNLIDQYDAQYFDKERRQ